MFGKIKAAVLFSAAALTVGVMSSSASAQVYWDNLTNATTFAGVASSSAPVAGQGNLQTGMALLLGGGFVPGVSQISEIQVPLGNLTPAAITNRPVRLRVWIWESVNTAAIGTGSTTPVFSQLKDTGAGAGNPTLTFTLPSLTLNSGSLTVLTGTFAPITLTPTTSTLIGISFNWQVNNGAGFVSAAGLNTTIIGGTAQAAPLVGSNLFGPAPAGAYFRSANSTVDVNGQFAGGSARNVGNNSGVPFILAVPEPTAMGLLAPMGVALVRRRRA